MPGPVSDTTPTLAERMRTYVAAHPEAEATLRPHIETLENIDHAMSAQKIVGIWARARRAWCELTGEELF
jgi:hypothetical protein